MNKSIVLLRGLARGSEHWLDFPQLLQSALIHDKVFCIDIAGNGRRVNETSPSTMKAAIEDLASQLNLIPPPYYFVSLSLGSMICLQAIEEAKLPIKKAIIINPSHASCPIFFRMQFKAMIKLLWSIMKGIKSRERVIYDLTSNNHNHLQKKLITQQFINIHQKKPFKTSNLLKQLHIAKQFSKPLSQSYDHQHLIVASSKDRLVNPICAIKIAKALDAKIIFHERAGHDIALDDPNWLIYQCEQFFNNPLNIIQSIEKKSKYNNQNIKPTIGF